MSFANCLDPRKSLSLIARQIGRGDGSRPQLGILTAPAHSFSLRQTDWKCGWAYIWFMLAVTWQNLRTTFRTSLQRQEVWVLVPCLIVVLGIWGFVAIADEVREGDTQQFDERIMQMLRHQSQPVGPSWLVEVGLDITALGGIAVLSLIILLACGYLALQRKYHAMWLVLIATFGGQLLSSGLKMFFDRPRPDQSLHLAEVYTASFPSGHSMLSAVVYLTLGTLLARVEPRRRTKAFLVTAALLLTFLVGISRVYIGVHYPTDVLAGWSAGLAWALLCWMFARYLQRHGKVENDGSVVRR
jgi:undecaprenyl-diphosphatase